MLSLSLFGDTGDDDDDDDGDGYGSPVPVLCPPATNVRLATEGERQRDRNEIHGPEPSSCPCKRSKQLLRKPCTR